MIKVNLISKKSRAYKGRDWTRIIILSLFGLIGAYFLIETLYVIISMNVISRQIKKVNSESLSISNLMLANNEKLSRFVLTKQILTKIQDINKEKFQYKDYLDQISALLPDGNLLTSVDFATKGWISVSVSSNNIIQLSQLEKTMLGKDTWAGNKFFSGAYIESVSRAKTGVYTVRLRFELKK